MKQKIYSFGSIIFLLFPALLANQTSFAQNKSNIFPTTGSVGIGTTAVDKTAILEIKSQTQGFLPPRMTALQRDAIFNPAKGLMVFVVDGTTPGYYFYNGSQWQQLNGTGSTYVAGSGIAINGNNITNTSPNIPVSLTGSGATMVTGTYPNFTISSTDNNSTYTGGNGIIVGPDHSITNAAPDKTVALTGSGSTTVTGTYPNFTISSTDNNTTYTGGNGIIVGPDHSITNSAPDKTVALTGSGSTTVTGAYPNFTISSTDNNTMYTGGNGIIVGPDHSITNSAPDQTVAVNAGEGISVAGTYPNFTVSSLLTSGNGIIVGPDHTINNSAPDIPVSLTGSGGTMVSGTYPNFTISSTENNITYTGGNGIIVGPDHSITNTAPNIPVFLTGSGGTTVSGTYPNFTIFSDAANNTFSPWTLGLNGTDLSYVYNVGIGTNVPTQKLDVVGNINIRAGFALYQDNSKLLANDVQSRNISAGSGAGDASFGLDNAFFGNSAGANTISGGANTAMGSGTLSTNDNGFGNTAIGYKALNKNTFGSQNTAIGITALSSNVSGTGNTAIGQDALANSTSASDNTVIGTGASVTGSNNTMIGAFSFAGATYDNSSGLGYGTVISASNQVRIGNGSVQSIGGFQPWTNFSDGRFKKNIKEDVKGLEFINLLKPVTYTLDLTGVNAYFQKNMPNKKTKEGGIQNSDEQQLKENEKIIHNGFIAQEVEAVAKKIGYNFSGVDAPKNESDVYGLRYSDFVVPLVKAVQELSKMNNEKDAAIYELKKQNDIHQKQIDELKTMMLQLQQNFNSCNACGQVSAAAGQSAISNKLSVISSASLSQNIPNPFNHSTTISYSLPQQYSSAKIIVVDKSGRVLKEINLSNSSHTGGSWKGAGSITVDASTLTSGAYNYSLYVDGKLVGTKQMVLAK